MSAPGPDRGSRSGAILTFLAGSIAVSALLWQIVGGVDAAPAPTAVPAPAPVVAPAAAPALAPAPARASQSAAARPAAPRAPRPTLRTRGS